MMTQDDFRQAIDKALADKMTLVIIDSQWGVDHVRKLAGVDIQAIFATEPESQTFIGICMVPQAMIARILSLQTSMSQWTAEEEVARARLSYLGLDQTLSSRLLKWAGSLIETTNPSYFTQSS